MKKTALLTVAAALLLSPLAAVAAELPTRIVKYGDLDLTRPDGVARLERRIAAAARSMCAVDNIRNVKAVLNANRCRAAAIASAQEQTQVAVAEARSSQQVASSQVARPALR